MLEDLKKSNQTMLDGAKAFDLYATLGLPLELTRDVARESNLDVNEAGFKKAMEEHKIQSGAGKPLDPWAARMWKSIAASLKD
jgi:alanyl-tRNA synthetase